MKTILIVLVCAGVLGVAGFFVGGSMTSVPAATTSASTGDLQRDLFNAQKAFSQGADVMARRQKNAALGSGVGLAIGVTAGLVLSAMTGKPKRN